MTIVIQSTSPSNIKPYEHLIPIARALIADGNIPSKAHGLAPIDEFGFYHDKDGWICILRNPINFGLIDKDFELPPSIEINEEENTIFCRKSWVEIRGNVK
jgi:hypothetical protein